MNHEKYRHPKDLSGQNSLDGGNAEDLFKEIAEAKGFKVKASTREEQFKHIDFWLEKNRKKTSHEIKARKKISRNEGNYNDGLIWVEWGGVDGKSG
mgnify:FL=1